MFECMFCLQSDAGKGWKVLQTKLKENGAMSDNVEKKLCAMAEAAAGGDFKVALKLNQELSASDWSNHKRWLKGMKSLLQLSQSKFAVETEVENPETPVKASVFVAAKSPTEVITSPQIQNDSEVVEVSEGDTASSPSSRLPEIELESENGVAAPDSESPQQSIRPPQVELEPGNEESMENYSPSRQILYQMNA